MGKKKNRREESPVRAGLNELDGSEEQQDSLPQVKPSHTCRVAFTVSLSVLQMALGAGGAVFLLFLDGFVVNVWTTVYVSSIAHAATLLLVGFFGFLALIKCRAATAVLYCVLAAALLTTSAVSSTYVIEGYSNDFSEIGSSWAIRTSTGEASQSDLCEIERTLHCSGWTKTCEQISQDQLLRALLFEAEANNTNCPLCVSRPPANYTVTCKTAVRDVMQFIVFGGVPLNFLLVVGSVSSVLFFFRRLRQSCEEERSQLVTEGMQYL
jgi:hypothetical protein